MATLKELRIRIRSVSSTQKITKAMKVVAASKLRRAREKAEAARPFAERMEGMLRSVRASMADSNAGGTELLVGNGRNDTHLLVLVSSDRGLCGGLNNTLIREARKLVAQLKSEGKKVKIIIHGKKANDVLKKEMKDSIIFQQDGMRDLNFQDAKDLAEQLITRFDDGEFDVCTIFYNHFASAISQKVTIQQLIPLPEKAEKAEGAHGGLLKPPYEYEPDEESIVRELLPRNLAVQIYHALLENGASEQGARMTAMDNATRNAGEMIGKLTLSYNRSRQAAITTELTEIISGAESL